MSSADRRRKRGSESSGSDSSDESDNEGHEDARLRYLKKVQSQIKVKSEPRIKEERPY